MSPWTRSSRLLIVAALAVTACMAPPVEPPSRFDPERESETRSEPRPEPVVQDGLRYRASFTYRSEVALDVSVVIENPGTRPRRVRFGETCVVLLRAYWYPAGGLAWDMGDGKAGCRDRMVEVALEPGESRAFEVGVSSLSILWGRPEGTYRLTAYLRPLEGSEIELDL
ncbi:MAG: hypothetical protein R3326_04465, partial [Gemmatimonadota bacterium]|nr:hypothetical protein [Gemmatimonadota bacterium]